MNHRGYVQQNKYTSLVGGGLPSHEGFSLPSHFLEQVG